MNIAANFCFALALLITAGLLVLGLKVPAAGRGQMDFTVVLLVIPLWPCLLLGYGVVTAQDGFDWLPGSRGWHYLLVLSACTALVAVTGFTYVLWNEPRDQIPWAVWPFMWAALLLPVIAVVCGFLALNPALTSDLSPRLWRLPLAAAGGLSLLIVIGLLAQLIVDSQLEANRRDQALVAAQQGRDAQYLAEVQALDAAKDFGALLRFTNIFNDPPTRNLALARLQAHPNLTAALAAHVRAGGFGCEDVLTFLEGSDVTIAAQLVEPVREAILCRAKQVRDELHGHDFLYEVNFDAYTRRVLAVADRFRANGVDYLPAVREFRAAMEEPNPRGFVPGCRRTLDQWIAVQTRAAR